MSVHPSRLPVTLLARAPEKGRVKTRLAREVGDALALALHEALLLDVIDRLAGWPLTWAMTSSDDACARARRLAYGIAHETQRDGDLGARIEEALTRRGPGASIVVGSDCPFLSEALLEEAAVHASRGFLAPARDGGFVLLAAPPLPPGTLACIEWGSERVFEQARDALRRAGFECFVAPEAEQDLDEAADLPLALVRLEAAPNLAPRTLALLRALAPR